MIALDQFSQIVWTKEALVAEQEKFAEYFFGVPWEDILNVPPRIKKGRPTMPPEIIGRIGELAAAQCSRAEIARALGLNWHQVDRYVDRETIKKGRPGRKKVAKSP